jgi:hypothetical protein
MNSNNPKTIEGKTYDKLGISLATTTRFNESDTGVSVSCRFHYYRTDEEGKIDKLDREHDVQVLIGNIYQSNDEAAQVAFGKIQAAIQEYINSKGI